jgi:hypothetical protein
MVCIHVVVVVDPCSFNTFFTSGYEIFSSAPPIDVYSSLMPSVYVNDMWDQNACIID